MDTHRVGTRRSGRKEKPEKKKKQSRKKTVWEEDDIVKDSKHQKTSPNYSKKHPEHTEIYFDNEPLDNEADLNDIESEDEEENEDDWDEITDEEGEYGFGENSRFTRKTRSHRNKSKGKHPMTLVKKSKKPKHKKEKCILKNCYLCANGRPKCLDQIAKVGWREVVIVLLNCVLRAKLLSNVQDEKTNWVHLPTELYPLIPIHWDLVCPKTKCKQWKKRYSMKELKSVSEKNVRLGDTLAHNSDYFVKGVDLFGVNGFWTIFRIPDEFVNDPFFSNLPRHLVKSSSENPSQELEKLQSKLEGLKKAVESLRLEKELIEKNNKELMSFVLSITSLYDNNNN